VFDLLSMMALDYGNVDGVFGIEEEGDDDADPLLVRMLVRSWNRVRQNLRSHLPLHERRARLRAQLATLRNALPRSGLSSVERGR
jgi:hypothetical protein